MRDERTEQPATPLLWQHVPQRQKFCLFAPLPLRAVRGGRGEQGETWRRRALRGKLEHDVIPASRGRFPHPRFETERKCLPGASFPRPQSGDFVLFLAGEEPLSLSDEVSHRRERDRSGGIRTTSASGTNERRRGRDDDGRDAREARRPRGGSEEEGERRANGGHVEIARRFASARGEGRFGFGNRAAEEIGVCFGEHGTRESVSASGGFHGGRRGASLLFRGGPVSGLRGEVACGQGERRPGPRTSDESVALPFFATQPTRPVKTSDRRCLPPGAYRRAHGIRAQPVVGRECRGSGRLLLGGDGAVALPLARAAGARTVLRQPVNRTSSISCGPMRHCEKETKDDSIH